MKLSKQIIDVFVSYIDFKDIKEFVKNNPKLVKEIEEENQNTSNKKV